MDANGWHDAATCEERISALRESHARLLALVQLILTTTVLANVPKIHREALLVVAAAEKVSKP